MNKKTKSYAEEELDILRKAVGGNSGIESFVPEIIALVTKFGNSGQSGGSAPCAAEHLAETVKKLCLREPLSSIMGADAETGYGKEWVEIGRSTGAEYYAYQNSRCSALFREEGASPHYLDAIIWKGPNGTTFTGSALLATGKRILSRQRVKSFPFIPKSFVVDVKKDCDGNFCVNDEAQLKEVFEYYRYTKEFCQY